MPRRHFPVVLPGDRGLTAADYLKAVTAAAARAPRPVGWDTAGPYDHFFFRIYPWRSRFSGWHQCRETFAHSFRPLVLKLGRAATVCFSIQCNARFEKGGTNPLERVATMHRGLHQLENTLGFPRHTLTCSGAYKYTTKRRQQRFLSEWLLTVDARWVRSIPMLSYLTGEIRSLHNLPGYHVNTGRLFRQALQQVPVAKLFPNRAQHWRRTPSYMGVFSFEEKLRSDARVRRRLRVGEFREQR